MPDSLLVVMPFGALDRPALGPSLLAARAERDGHRCDVRYLTFRFADAIGLADYLWISDTVPYTAFAGEWVFAEALYGPRLDSDLGFIERVLLQTHGLSGADVARLRRIRARVEPFLEDCLAALPWADFDVVGFTSTFQQNLAALALARRVKETFPGTTVVFGGANWEGEMGEALHHRFPFVDVSCSGEADESFPALLFALDDGGSLAGIPGLVWRDRGASRTGPPGRPVEQLDDLPIPDFRPYFRDFRASGCGLDLLPRVLVETARGCWWGAHSHCTFCGLNGAGMAFRSKSPERVLDELRTLYERYGVTTVSAVDNILDMRYLRTVMPALAADGPRLDLFWEIKANLSHEQVRQLAAAGVGHVQPGIESLSDDILAKLRKGTNRLRNLELLKWCKELGVGVEWNLLFGVPGEDPADYAEMAAFFGAIVHLDPPSACGPIRLDRFSPYHQDPARFGMTNVRAMSPYRYLYDVDGDELDRIAYYFDFDFADRRQPLEYVGPALAAVERWRSRRHEGGLWWLERDDASITVLDERPGRPRRSSTIAGWKAAVYRACDRARSRDELRQLSELGGVAEDELDAFLDRCVAVEVMYTDGTRWLALAVHAPPRRAEPARRGPIRRLPLAVAHA